MSKHFTRAELIRSKVAQALSLDNTPPEHLLPHLDFTMAGLERLRAFLGHPIVVSSGYRSPELNAAVKGSPRSQHMSGQAADFTCPGFGSPEDVVRALMPMRFVLGIDQLILEPGWVHASFTLAPRYQVLGMLEESTPAT
jgi:zinc D-Ala-D-Ala carboxypeptidase